MGIRYNRDASLADEAVVRVAVVQKQRRAFKRFQPGRPELQDNMLAEAERAGMGMGCVAGQGFPFPSVDAGPVGHGKGPSGCPRRLASDGGTSFRMDDPADVGWRWRHAGNADLFFGLIRVPRRGDGPQLERVDLGNHVSGVLNDLAPGGIGGKCAENDLASPRLPRVVGKRDRIAGLATYRLRPARGQTPCIIDPGFKLVNLAWR